MYWKDFEHSNLIVGDLYQQKGWMKLATSLVDESCVYANNPIMMYIEYNHSYDLHCFLYENNFVYYSNAKAQELKHVK